MVLFSEYKYYWSLKELCLLKLKIWFNPSWPNINTICWQLASLYKHSHKILYACKKFKGILLLSSLTIFLKKKFFWMLFRLHTHVCANNSFSFSTSLRKQVRKSVELKTEWSALRSPCWSPSMTSGAEIPAEDSAGTLVAEETLWCKGLLGNSYFTRMENVPFSLQTRSLMSDQ